MAAHPFSAREHIQLGGPGCITGLAPLFFFLLRYSCQLFPSRFRPAFFVSQFSCLFIERLDSLHSKHRLRGSGRADCGARGHSKSRLRGLGRAD